MGLGSGIRDPGSGIWKKPIPDPGSRGQKGTGSRIRIRNTVDSAKIIILVETHSADRNVNSSATKNCFRDF